MFRSILDFRVAITTVFSSELIRSDSHEAVLDIATKTSKAYSVLQQSLSRKNWSNLSHVTPIFELFASMLTFLDSDLAQISLLSLAFSTLSKFKNSKLSLDKAEISKCSLRAHYNVIGSDAYIL